MRGSFRVSDEMRRRIDELVTRGEYKNRSDAYRESVEFLLSLYEGGSVPVKMTPRARNIVEGVIGMGYGVSFDDVLLQALLEYRDKCLDRERRAVEDSSGI